MKATTIQPCAKVTVELPEEFIKYCKLYKVDPKTAVEQYIRCYPCMVVFPSIASVPKIESLCSGDCIVEGSKVHKKKGIKERRHNL